jgi:signal transduction histidine kinase
MTIKRDPSRALQVGFLALLIISMAQAVYWIRDNVLYTRLVEQALYADDPAAAVAELADASEARTNRYVWEGGFFLAVLFGGMLIMTRTIRHDRELRRRQQNFLAAVSHEFKSPLASVRLAAETLVLRSSDADGKRLGQRILEDGERLLRMVDNLLDTTRLEEGRHHPTLERISLRTAVDASVAEIAERTRRHEISVEIDVPEPLTVSADRTALESILRNLLDNAVKACIAGSGHAIAIGAAESQDKLTLTVRDDGIGFPPEEAEMIFEKFYRLGDELKRTTAGSGLGLYLVKRLAEMCGATVGAVSSGIGRGATLTITWPKSTPQ